MRALPLLLAAWTGSVVPAQERRPADTALFGRIVTVVQDGVPAAEVWVTDAGGADVARTVADGDGYYQLRRLPTGPLRLHARGEGVVDGSIEVEALGRVRAATLVLEPGELLRGVVRWADGSAVAGAEVLVCGATELPAPFDWCAETTTDDAGGWQLPSAPLRPLVVRAFVPGHELGEQTVARGRAGIVQLTMPAGRSKARPVEVKGVPPGVSVVVRCEPNRVGGRPAMRLPRGAREVAVDGEGLATLWSLPVPHEVRVDALGHRSMPVIVPCKADAADALQFALSPLPADLIEPSTILSGRLVDELGAGLPGVTLIAVSEDRESAPVVSGDDGRFEMDVPVRTKVLCRLGVLSRSWRLAGKGVELGVDGISWLTVAADPDEPLRLHAARAGSVRGTLLGPSGLPLAAAQVTLRLPSAGSRGRFVRSATDAGGRLDIPGLPARQFTVHIEGPAGLVGETTVDVTAGGEQAPLPVTFAPGGELRGRVTGLDGSPLPSVAIGFAQVDERLPAQFLRRIASSPGGRFVLTDRMGRFLLPRLAEGAWLAVPIEPAAGGEPSGERVDVVAGATAQLEIVVER